MATVKTNSSRRPQRTCIGCRKKGDKDSFIRIVVVGGVATVDESGKMQARGVYFCKNKDCIERARRNKGFAKTYGFSLTDELVQKLEETVEQ